MAMQIKRHYDLSALRVTLLADDDPPSVECALEFTRDHVPETVASWRATTAELGLPPVLDCLDSRGQGYPFTLPQAMIGELASALRKDAFPGRPLWLHLVKPYGHLGLLPWEQLLVPDLPVPVLRLPDFIVEPVRSRQSITVVLCADDGPGDQDEQAATVMQLAAKVSHAIPLPASVHIFTTAGLYRRLRSMRSPVEWADRVLLHDPADASDSGTWDAAPAESGSTDSAVGQRPHAWLDWVREAMCGQSVDVVHFLAPGVIRLDQGAPAFSGSPADPDDTSLSAVSIAALTRFTLQLGAWGCVFTSPYRNPSEMGLRLAATTLADLLPLTMLHHELRLDPDLAALSDGYRLMTSPSPGRPPRHPSVFLYCQPFQVETEPRKDELLPASPAAAPTEKVRSLLADMDTPTWVSAAQRYVEQYEWRLNQWQEPDQLPAPDALADGVARALKLIEGVVDRYAEAPTTPVSTPAALDISAGTAPNRPAGSQEDR
ncbi:MAG TPA: hypothetical protein VFR35_20850 [Actinoplanes sp.]|nr:hypothetical protein [Actinoplanes sp.]